MADRRIFFLEPGRWEGEGSIQLPIGDQFLPFTTVWEGNGSWWIHRVFLEGVEEPVVNCYRIEEGEEAPILVMESPHLGSSEGVLLTDSDRIGWEFRGAELSGFELFQRIDAERYQHRAEFLNPGGMQTKIAGEIRWVSESYSS